jgi:hypothetical protein
VTVPRMLTAASSLYVSGGEMASVLSTISSCCGAMGMSYCIRSRTSQQTATDPAVEQSMIVIMACAFRSPTLHRLPATVRPLCSVDSPCTVPLQIPCPSVRSQHMSTPPFKRLWGSNEDSRECSSTNPSRNPSDPLYSARYSPIVSP